MIYNILKKYEIKKELKTGNDENVSDDDDVEGGDDCSVQLLTTVMMSRQRLLQWSVMMRMTVVNDED